MTKAAMMKTVNAVAIMTGKIGGKDADHYNYKQVKEMYETALETLHAWADRPVEDEPTEEIPARRGRGAQMGVDGDNNAHVTRTSAAQSNTALFAEFLNYIDFSHPISEITARHISYREYEKDGVSHSTFKIDNQYYKANKKRMYKLVGEIDRHARNVGAFCYIEKKDRLGAYLVMRWG